ncbi:hypothetical protein BOO30_13090 [Vibrio navarrensis]|uniref:hypothetical protein n=1 Tax=Vibrio navarrensis TaxID=29495 RepID=UPI001869AD11|nr:hypothetical protein [Vibrio navarrensis]EGR2795022.1 hypothetical protein [Vibrio navarrensis]MBE4579216.1 hypothetical protein [Vibrio navarrensis]MBE4597318.1 hypothetical protein [Vibrio navarrensis]
MQPIIKNLILKIVQWFIFLPGIFLFSYVMRPILMLILVPGGLILLALIGGAEVRGEIKQMFKELL